VPAFEARKHKRFGRSSEPTPLSPPLDDAELAARLARGDRWAQEAFYRKYVALVWGVSLRLMGNRSDAEDLVQDTFAEALRDAKQLRDGRAFRRWVMSIAVHQAHRRFRRRRVLRTLGLDRGEEVATLDTLASPGAGPEVETELRKLGELLETLPARRRIVWTLRVLQGCSLDEVAELCGCSLATAKRDVQATHRALRERVDLEEMLDD
jgi:RNA polymerase sigma-70 factor, ECF subfamily